MHSLPSSLLPSVPPGWASEDGVDMSSGGSSFGRGPRTLCLQTSGSLGWEGLPGKLWWPEPAAWLLMWGRLQDECILSALPGILLPWECGLWPTYFLTANHKISVPTHVKGGIRCCREVGADVSPRNQLTVCKLRMVPGGCGALNCSPGGGDVSLL